MSHHTKPYEIVNKEHYADSVLIQQYNDTRDNKYIGELYGRYKSKVFGKCATMLSNDEEARDAVQDIFIKILGNIGKFSSGSSFSTWLYSITYNHCIDIIRRRGKTRTEELHPWYENIQEDFETCDARILEQKIQILNKILDNLAPDIQQILFLKYQDDKSMEEIRAILKSEQNKDITKSAIKMRLSRAKQKVQETLDAIGGFEI